MSTHKYMYIPEDIVRVIVGFADVPIDTRRAFGVYQKLVVDDKLEDLLAAVNKSKHTLIKMGDTTAYQTRCGKGCKLQHFVLRVNRYPEKDKYVLVKHYHKRNRWIQSIWVSVLT